MGIQRQRAIKGRRGKVARKRLEAVQDRVGRSKQVCGRSGSTRRPKVEEARGKEGREEGALWKVERLDDNRLVKMIMKKTQDCGTVSWQGEHEYDLLLRKCGLEGSETGSAKEWKERVHDKNCGDCMDGRKRREK